MGRRADVVLGADVGSTNVKIVALGADGHIVARARRPTPRRRHDPSIDADELLELLEDLIVETCGDTLAVQAICAAGVGEDGVLVDAAGRPTAPALAWFDPRRQHLFQELAPDLAPADGLGTATDPARTLVGWAWARRASGYDSACTWLALTDFASARWSRTGFLSDTLAARTAAWHIDTRSWVLDRVKATLGDPELLPEVVPAGTVVGPLHSARLAAAGVLRPDAVVVAGGHDHPIGGWGVEQLHPHAILDSMGTAEVVVAQAQTPPPLAADVDTAPGIAGGGATVLRVEELARNVDWACQDPDVAAAISGLISGVIEPDRHLASRTFRPGAAGGARPFYTPDAPADPLSRASAVLGALASLGGEAVDQVAAAAPPNAEVFAAGGWARSFGWLAIKHAVTGRSAAVVTEPETTAAGAALLAARAIGRQVDPAATLVPASGRA